MKHLKKMIIIFALLIGTVFCATVNGAEYADTLRVGIYYGSSAVSNLTVQSPGGFSLGYTTGRDFFPVVTVSDTDVVMAKKPAGTYHLLYSSHETSEELNSKLQELQASGIDVFPAYYNSLYCAVGGSFSTQEDAQAHADSFANGCSPIAFSENAISITNSQSGKILFVGDHKTNLPLVFSADFPNDDTLLTISGSAKGTYRGGFQCMPNQEGALTVVNIVPVEDYLYSVVCREMSSSWPIEALKTQAVCARNFALGRINYHKSYGFDVCRTVCCQAYSSTADQSESVHTAVDETRGELLFHEDDLVQAVYSSSMGSCTENVKNVWGSSFPYLVSVDNPYEDTENIYNGKWTKTLTKSRATEIMKNSGNDVGDVISITALEYTDAGRVLRLQVKGTAGEKVFERERCRTIFSEATYSQKYTVSQGGITTYPVVKVYDGNKVQSKTMTSVSVLTGSNTKKTVSNTFVASNGTKSRTYTTQKTEGDANTFVFSGEGWGHGVGMSQYGAKGMAEAGFGYEDILTHYYSGTHIEKAY